MKRYRSLSVVSLITIIAVGGSIMTASAIAHPSNHKPPEEIERRVDALLRQMTLQEKVGQLVQLSSDSAGNLDLVKQGRVGSLLDVVGAEKTNAVQRIAVEQTRLKIPLLFGYDAIHGYRTIFPVPLASAGSFDLPLIEEADRVSAREASASGVKWAFAPMVDITRDPRWGRVVEGSGEDPFLGSKIAVARVRGLQGADFSDPERVIACAKHYVGYGAAEGGREYNGVEISEQTLREIYLPPFHAAVDAGVGTLMAAFQDLNGIPASANRQTLTRILRGEWGFRGVVDSDYSSVHELVTHGVAANDAEAAAKALTAGVDMDMADQVYDRELARLVQSGKVSTAILDQAVKRVLRLKFRAGLFEHPYVDAARERAEILTPRNLEVARKLAQESIVLLKNENLLPLTKDKKIAVIGPLADDKADQLGSCVGQGHAEDAVTPLEGIASKIAKKSFFYSMGIDLPALDAQLTSGATGATPPVRAKGSIAAVEARIDSAVLAAKSADVVVLVLGETGNMTGESSARAFLDLPRKQQQLLEAVVATGKPVVLVLESGRPLDIRWASEHVAAIIQAWYPGIQAGNAIADILFGDVAPSARLPISWPRSVGQIPVYYNHKSTGRWTSGDRWHTGYIDEDKTPLYPFGHGLTYTQFRYDNLKVQSLQIAATGSLRVSAEITNTGKIFGTEVVQLYVHDRVAPTSRPVRELKGFERVSLQPGEHKKVEFVVAAKELGSYDSDLKWVAPVGVFDVWVAPNSAEGIAGTFEVVADTN